MGEGVEVLKSMASYGKSKAKRRVAVDNNMEIHDCDVFESRAWRDKLHKETLTVWASYKNPNPNPLLGHHSSSIPLTFHDHSTLRSIDGPLLQNGSVLS